MLLVCDCFSTVVIANLSKDSLKRKLAVSSSRHDPGSLRSCKLCVATISHCHPLFKKGVAASVYHIWLCRWEMTYCPIVRRLLNLLFLNG